MKRIRLNTQPQIEYIHPHVQSILHISLSIYYEHIYRSIQRNKLTEIRENIAKLVDSLK